MLMRKKDYSLALREFGVRSLRTKKGLNVVFELNMKREGNTLRKCIQVNQSVWSVSKQLKYSHGYIYGYICIGNACSVQEVREGMYGSILQCPRVLKTGNVSENDLKLFLRNKKLEDSSSTHGIS